MTVGTVKKSSATISATWFFRNARQGGEGGRRGRTRYFSMVDLATVIPSVRNSPRMRGEPQRGFAVEMSRIRVRTSWLTTGRPGLLWLSRAQWARKRVRCQAITVAGCTKTRTSCQRRQCRTSHTQKIRSVGRIAGRRIDCLYMASWCRSAPTSRWRLIRERNILIANPSSACAMGIIEERILWPREGMFEAGSLQ